MLHYLNQLSSFQYNWELLHDVIFPLPTIELSYLYSLICKYIFQFKDNAKES